MLPQEKRQKAHETPQRFANHSDQLPQRPQKCISINSPHPEIASVFPNAFRSATERYALAEPTFPKWIAT